MKYRRGFTLLEVIIVITIVAMMAVFAISSYGSARTRAKLDLITDLLVSTLKQQQNLAKSGKDLDCHGLVFDMDAAEEERVQLVQAPYVSVSGNNADFCDMTSPTLTPYREMENFTIESIEETKDSNFSSGTRQMVKKVAFMFKPPLAKVVLGTDLNNLTVPGKNSPVDNPFVLITILSPAGNESRGFVFDTTSGVAKRMEVPET